MKQMMECAGSLDGYVSPWLLILMVFAVLNPWSHCLVWPLA